MQILSTNDIEDLNYDYDDYFAVFDEGERCGCCGTCLVSLYSIVTLICWNGIKEMYYRLETWVFSKWYSSNQENIV